MKKFKKETIAAKAGIGSDAHHGSIVPPLYLSSNFKYEELGKEQEYEYTRETNHDSNMWRSNVNIIDCLHWFHVLIKRG